MIYKKTLLFAGQEISIETGRLAKQASASILLSFSQTVVLSTVVQMEKPREGTDFFPLTVDYEEKMYAAGKIKGSRFIKREGRATDQATISARLIDRSIRPLFKESERRETQVSVNVLAFDGQNDADVLGIVASSLALSISGITWDGPLAACRVIRLDGKIIFNPTYAQRALAQTEITVVSRRDEVVMLDVEAKETPETEVFDLISAGVEENKKLITFIESIVADLKPQPLFPEITLNEEEQKKQSDLLRLKNKVNELVLANFDLVFGHKSKLAYKKSVGILQAKIDENLKADNNFDKELAAKASKFMEGALDLAMRQRILSSGERIDGRKLDEIRPLSAEVAILPRVHGSALFTRGETQVLTVVTLGAPGDEQTIDSMEEDTTKHYMHHYNFPGWSVGEVKPMRMPTRREIGHGALAEKALEPVLPPKDSFPYTIRLVSETLESNGSSSQAATCASTLALMDAGVPITRPVAGIAMGLITNPDNSADYKILTDIQGIEDHTGDMDFKVSGTSEGVTAVQLDIKTGGIHLDIVKNTLDQAKIARLKILEVMKATLAAPRADLAPSAPRIETVKINPEKIRDLIGPGGKMINSIIAATGVQIDIEDDGRVFVTSNNVEAMIKAKKMIANVTKEAEVGATYDGRVTRIMDFGAFVEILPKQEGLLHVSEISWDRVENVSDVLKVGDIVSVKLVEIDNLGRLNLSAKRLVPQPERGSNSDRRPKQNFSHSQNNPNSRQSEKKFFNQEAQNYQNTPKTGFKSSPDSDLQW